MSWRAFERACVRACACACLCVCVGATAATQALEGVLLSATLLLCTSKQRALLQCLVKRVLSPNQAACLIGTDAPSQNSARPSFLDPSVLTQYFGFNFVIVFMILRSCPAPHEKPGGGHLRARQKLSPVDIQGAAGGQERPPARGHAHQGAIPFLLRSAARRSCFRAVRPVRGDGRRGRCATATSLVEAGGDK